MRLLLLRRPDRDARNALGEAVPDKQHHDTTPGADIRPVEAADLPALRTLIDASGLFPGDQLDGMLGPHLNGEPTDGFWLTLDDGSPRALALGEPERMTEGTWNVLLIAVSPERRGQGLGGTLIAHIEARLAAQGERVLLVETSRLAEFEQARRFYRTHGYDQEARIRDYYAAGDD